MGRLLKITEFREPETPVCAHCGGGGLRRKGSGNGRARYRCRDCGRQSYGVARGPVENRFPCPYCRERCRREGHTPDGWQRYLCLGCGRKNTNLYPVAPHSPGGPFTHIVHFCLHGPAMRNLAAYCNGGGLSVAQAVREILREAACAEAVLP